MAMYSPTPGLMHIEQSLESREQSGAADNSLEEDLTRLEDILQAADAEIATVRNLIDDGNEIRDKFASLIGKDSRHAGLVHLRLIVRQLDEASEVVLASQIGKRILDRAADRRLAEN